MFCRRLMIRQWAFVAVICLTVNLFSLRTQNSAAVAQNFKYFTIEEYNMLDEIFRVHANFFLSSEAITNFGFPLTAYKVNDRARFGYSNPAEWGYTLQSWIVAAEREIISINDAEDKIRTALTTMQSLQQDSAQNHKGLFYPYYKVTDSNGNDLPAPFHDEDPRIPSGDNALLYASLLITEGWAIHTGKTSLEKLAQSIRENMDFRIFLFKEGGKLYIAHQINADTGKLYSDKWDVFADEGGVVTWIAYFSSSITFDEYRVLTESQIRRPAIWSCHGTTYTVKEAAWFNAMFTWGARSLAGFPISSFDAPNDSNSLYCKCSFMPAVEAHLAYGTDFLKVHYPAFSDAMSQGVVRRYTPPNLADEVPPDPPEHVVPHAFFVPFNGLPDINTLTRTFLISKIEKLRDDEAHYYHDAGPYPFGFEVTASPYENDMGYNGAGEGRNIFETLSEAYIALSLFNALQLADGKPTFYGYVRNAAGYEAKVYEVLKYLYPVYKGDYDIDGDLDGSDLAKFAAGYTTANPELADLDNDGDVDVNDLTIFAANFGKMKIDCLN